MKDMIILIILACMIGGIVLYLSKAKRRGETCIGCPHAKQCGGKCSESVPKTPEDDEI